MTPDIERIAREAGLLSEHAAGEWHSYCTDGVLSEGLARFAQLIAAECANDCDAIAIGDPTDPNNDVGECYRADVACDCADAIRERFGLIPASP